jgi:hypothetical protein
MPYCRRGALQFSVQKETPQRKALRAFGLVASMDSREAIDRFRQALQKRRDAIVFAFGIDPTRGEIDPRPVERPKFFFGREDIPGRLRLLRERTPEQVEIIIETAHKICQHRFDLLGFKDLNCGREIDWQLDVVHGKRAPLAPWYKVPYLDFDVVGDAKITWELNRHQHLVTLAKAYLLTNNHRFASELVNQWKDWQENNPYPRGINWASSLEIAFRSLSWLWVHQLMEGTLALTTQFREQWLRALALNGRHIELYLSTYFSPNTHLLGEAVALFFIGTLCPELRSSSRWRRQGWDIVLRESKRQVRADGFYFEQSTHYHVYALDFFLHAELLASLNGISIPAGFRRTVDDMLEALAILCRAGAPSRWGDDDGGRVFDPQRNRANHFTDPLATGAALLGRGDFKFLAGDLREETIWLLGEKGVVDLDRVEAKPPHMTSAALVDSGLYVMSSDVRRLQAVVDAGPQGAFAAGHGHADALSLNIHADGNELIGDPGTFEYVGASETERKQFRGTAAHNTLELDGKSQSEEMGPFSWRSIVTTKAEEWITGQHFDLFVGSHEGYSRPGTSVVHRRWVFFRKPRFWVVRDAALGTGRHQLDLRWHVNPQLSLTRESTDHFFFSDKKSGILLFPASTASWTKSVGQGPWSTVYGAREPASEVRFTTVTKLPVELVTLLMPARPFLDVCDGGGKLAEVQCGPHARAYQFIENKEEHVFLFAHDNRWKFQEWVSDASFMYCSRAAGKLSLLIFCNCRHVEFRGSTVISSSKPVVRVEISDANGTLEVNCSDNNLRIAEDVLSCAFEARDGMTRERPRNRS